MTESTLIAGGTDTPFVIAGRTLRSRLMVGTGTTLVSSMSGTTPIIRTGAVLMTGTTFRIGSVHIT